MFSKVIAFVTLCGVALASLEPVHQAPQPYKFGYNIKDKHGDQYREEEGNGAGGVKGSYGFTDERGVKRQVDYVADHAGFRAQIKTNEPGTANQDPAAVKMISDAPYAGGVALGRGYGGLGYSNEGNNLALGAEGRLGYGVNGRGIDSLEGLGYGVNGLGVGNLGGLRYGVNGLGVGNLGGLESGVNGLGVSNLGGLGYGVNGLGVGNLGGLGYEVNGVGVGNLGGLGYGVNGLGDGNLGGLGYGGYGLDNGNVRGLGYGVNGLRAGNFRGLGYGRYGLGGSLFGGLGYSRFGY